MNEEAKRQRYGRPHRGQNVRMVTDKKNARAAANYERSKHAFELSEAYREKKRSHKSIIFELMEARNEHIEAIAALNKEIKRIEEEI